MLGIFWLIWRTEVISNGPPALVEIELDCELDLVRMASAFHKVFGCVSLWKLQDAGWVKLITPDVDCLFTESAALLNVFIACNFISNMKTNCFINATSTAHKSTQGLAFGSAATVWAAERSGYSCQVIQEQHGGEARSRQWEQQP